MRNRGITLVEILVTIAIVTSLMALTFGALAGVRERARQTTCESNRKQIWTAISLYRTDYDGIDPSPGDNMMYSQMGLPTGRDCVRSFYVKLFTEGLGFCPSYHTYSRINTGAKFITGYWYGYATFDSLPDHTWTELGAQHSIFYCDQHNIDPDIKGMNSFDMFRVIYVQLDGRTRNLTKSVQNYRARAW